MAKDLMRKALIECEKYEVQCSYRSGQPKEYDFKVRQEAFYVELLCWMYDLLQGRDEDVEHRRSYERILLKIAKGLLVFSDPSTEEDFSHINKNNNTLFVSTIYYICGYEAIASLLLRLANPIFMETAAAQQLYSLVRGAEYPDREEKQGNSMVLKSILDDNKDILTEFKKRLRQRKTEHSYNTEREFFDEQMLMFALNRFTETNLAADLTKYDPDTEWLPYIRYSAQEGILSFLPSQRDAIEKGLLNFEGSFSLKMPTSAGKSYITELLIYQELTKHPESKILYLTPLRSLSRELGEKFKKIKNAFGYKVAVKYGGGSSADSVLGDDIQILVSTPEFFISLEKGIEDLLEGYKLIICDEGQLLDDYARGVNYEMLLTRLRKFQDKRFLFISAIIPNIQDINEWLGGTDKLIGDSTYRPSGIKLAKAVVNGNDIDLEVYGKGYHNVVYSINGFVTSPCFINSKGRNIDISCATALQAVNAGSVMLYVSFKRGPRGCESFSRNILDMLGRSNMSLPGKGGWGQKRELLYKYVKYQCGSDYLLVTCIANGLAYHHGDIPQDFRELIEEAVDDEVLPLVICTSTLAEGVNLPLKTIVLGNINDPLYAAQGWYLNKATLKNIIGRVGRAGRERYGMVIFPDNQKDYPFTLIQDALCDEGIPEVQGTLFRLVNYLVNTKKVKNINDLNELLGDDDLVAAIDLMITKSVDVDSLEDLSIEELISDSLAYKLGNEVQRTMLNNVFQARYNRLKEQFDAKEYFLLKATGFTVRDLAKAHELMSEADAAMFNNANEGQWREFLDYLMDKLYQLPSVQDDLEDDSHKYVGDYINDINLMKHLTALWMEGWTYKDIAEKAKEDKLLVDKVIVSIIFMQNCLCRQIRPLMAFMKSKYGVENTFLDSFHELMSVGIQTETQMYAYHNGQRNRLCLIALQDYLTAKGMNGIDNEAIRAYVKSKVEDMAGYLSEKEYPVLVMEMMRKWI